MLIMNIQNSILNTSPVTYMLGKLSWTVTQSLKRGNFRPEIAKKRFRVFFLLPKGPPGGQTFGF